MPGCTPHAARRSSRINEIRGASVASIPKRRSFFCVHSKVNGRICNTPIVKTLICVATALEGASLRDRLGRASDLRIIETGVGPVNAAHAANGANYSVSDPTSGQSLAVLSVQVVDAIVRHSKGETLPPQMLIPTKLYKKADAENDPELK